MNSLRNHWRRSALSQFFTGLDPIDRATFLIGVLLAFAVAISLHVILRAPAADVLAPFDIDASAMRGRS